MDNFIERLHNCPNCGGTLQDDGACRFCGSRIYDFLQVDLKDYKPTYIRTKVGGKIIIMPVVFDSMSVNMSNESSTLYFNDTPYICMAPVIPTGTLDFTVSGDIIVEDTEVTGSEY